MRLSTLLFFTSSLTIPALADAQREFREYLPFEGYNAAAALPADYDVPGELEPEGDGAGAEDGIESEGEVADAAAVD